MKVYVAASIHAKATSHNAVGNQVKAMVTSGNGVLVEAYKVGEKFVCIHKRYGAALKDQALREINGTAFDRAIHGADSLNNFDVKFYELDVEPYASFADMAAAVGQLIN